MTGDSIPEAPANPSPSDPSAPTASHAAALGLRLVGRRWLRGWEELRDGSREAAAFEIRLAMRSPLFGGAVEITGCNIMTPMGWDIVPTTILYLHDPLTISLELHPKYRLGFGFRGCFSWVTLNWPDELPAPSGTQPQSAGQRPSAFQGPDVCPNCLRRDLTIYRNSSQHNHGPSYFKFGCNLHTEDRDSEWFWITLVSLDDRFRRSKGYSRPICFAD